MFALETTSAAPATARVQLRALPAARPRVAAAGRGFDALVSLAERVLPGAVLVLHRPGQHPELLTWPEGVMGRRVSIEALALRVCGAISAGSELSAAVLGDHPRLARAAEVRDAGPLGGTFLSLAGGVVFGVLRGAGEWAPEDLAAVRDLAEAFAGECERQRLQERAAQVEDAASRLAEEKARGAQARAADRLSALGPLLSGICHELNNPLTSIKSFAELLLLDARSEDDREALEIVQREAHRAARIVSDLRIATRQSHAGLVPAEERPEVAGGDLPLSGALGEEAAERSARRGLRVLVVDDEAPIRFSLARYMERRGHEVLQAEDGRVALRMLEEPGARYDIIVADMRMPGMDGRTLLARLRERGDGLEHRLILMTGDAQGSGNARVTEEAGVPVMWKPFELAEVAQIIEAHAGLLAV